MNPDAPKILAIDPGRTCGWAHSDGMSGTWDLRRRRDESSGMALVRLTAKLCELHKALGVDIVVFEAARAARNFTGLVSVAEIQGAIKLWCEHRAIPYKGYSPSEVKRMATGKGNAKKDEVFDAARREWPEINIVDHNHADALWLLQLAKNEIG